MVRNIYISGTEQHSGKTLISVGLVASLKKRGYRVGYMKPVGQRTVEMGDSVVDEDVALINTTYGIDTHPKACNPVTIPHGFTRSFLAEGRSNRDLVRQIREGYERVVGKDGDAADIVVIEGTGHAGVGSVIGLCNATVARLLNARTLVIVGGGIGRPVDQFTINRALFNQEGVDVLGVVANKVYDKGRDSVCSALSTYFGNHDVPLYGVLPYRRMLTEITLQQILDETDAEVLNGHEQLHQRIQHCIVGAGEPHRLISEFRSGVLAIMPGDRDDLVLAALGSHQLKEDVSLGTSVCLTEGLTPPDNIMDLVCASKMPMIALDDDTFEVTSRISSLVAKIQPTDAEKLHLAEQLVEEYVDIDALVENILGDEA
ncbi:MAG: AAA family ATPase [Armatimonadota bacterium]